MIGGIINEKTFDLNMYTDIELFNKMKNVTKLAGPISIRIYYNKILNNKDANLNGR